MKGVSIEDRARKSETYDGDEILGDDLIETTQETLDLLFDGRIKSILGR